MLYEGGMRNVMKDSLTVTGGREGFFEKLTWIREYTGVTKAMILIRPEAKPIISFVLKLVWVGCLLLTSEESNMPFNVK